MKAFTPTYKEGTYGYVFELLKHTADAVYQGETLIAGNPELEFRRARDVEALEDMLTKILSESDLVKGGIKYVRQYEHMYNKK
jgi:hypothetical protein